jgi:hypothetical protein
VFGIVIQTHENLDPQSDHHRRLSGRYQLYWPACHSAAGLVAREHLLEQPVQGRVQTRRGGFTGPCVLSPSLFVLLAALCVVLR